MNPGFSLFPDEASAAAPGVDLLFFFIIGVSVFFATATAVLLIYFALRHRRRSDDQFPEPIHGSTGMEIVWALFLLALFLGIFFWARSSTSAWCARRPTRWRSTSSASSGCGTCNTPKAARARSTSCTSRSAGRSSSS